MKMLKHYSAAALMTGLLGVPCHSHGDEDTDSTRQDYIDFSFTEISQEPIESGILKEKTLFHTDPETFGEETDTTMNMDAWKQLYMQMHNASFEPDDEELPPQSRTPQLRNRRIQTP